MDTVLLANRVKDMKARNCLINVTDLVAHGIQASSDPSCTEDDQVVIWAPNSARYIFQSHACARIQQLQQIAKAVACDVRINTPPYCNMAISDEMRVSRNCARRVQAMLNMAGHTCKQVKALNMCGRVPGLVQGHLLLGAQVAPWKL